MIRKKSFSLALKAIVWNSSKAIHSESPLAELQGLIWTGRGSGVRVGKERVFSFADCGREAECSSDWGHLFLVDFVWIEVR